MARKAVPPHQGRTDAEDGEAVDRFPNMTAQKEMDRAEHIRRAEALGATHKQATRHADDEVRDH